MFDSVTIECENPQYAVVGYNTSSIMVGVGETVSGSGNNLTASLSSTSLTITNEVSMNANNVKYYIFSEGGNSGGSGGTSSGRYYKGTFTLPVSLDYDESFSVEGVGFEPSYISVQPISAFQKSIAYNSSNAGGFGISGVYENGKTYSVCVSKVGSTGAFIMDINHNATPFFDIYPTNDGFEIYATGMIIEGEYSYVAIE